MNDRIVCPVCNRSAIEINICPNCQTDLSLIRMLHELPSLATIAPAPPVINYWQMGTILMAILFSVGLGLCLLI